MKKNIRTRKLGYVVLEVPPFKKTFSNIDCGTSSRSSIKLFFFKSTFPVTRCCLFLFRAISFDTHA